MTTTIQFYKDAAGAHRWRAKSSNGQIIGASSEGFHDKAEAGANLERLAKALDEKAVEGTHPLSGIIWEEHGGDHWEGNAGYPNSEVRELYPGGPKVLGEKTIHMMTVDLHKDGSYHWYVEANNGHVRRGQEDDLDDAQDEAYEAASAIRGLPSIHGDDDDEMLHEKINLEVICEDVDTPVGVYAEGRQDPYVFWCAVISAGLDVYGSISDDECELICEWGPREVKYAWVVKDTEASEDQEFIFVGSEEGKDGAILVTYVHRGSGLPGTIEGR